MQASQRGKEILSFEGFTYHSKRKNKDGTVVWVCSSRKSTGCYVSVKTQNGEILQPPAKQHSHDPEEQTREKGEFRRGLMEAAIQRPEANPSSLINEMHS